jgi:hypothetical protein
LVPFSANDLLQSWRFDWEPPKAVLRDVRTIDWILWLRSSAQAADPFVCPCGTVVNDPLDPAVMAIHQPHYAAAKAARQR